MNFMKKFYSFIVFALLFGLFNFICFMTRADYTTSFYISLAFGNFALLFSVLISVFSFAKRQIYLIYSYYVVTSVYQVVSVVLNLLFIWFKLENVKVNFVINVVLAVIFLILIFTSLASDADTAKKAKEHTKKLNYHYDMCDAVRPLKDRAGSIKANKKLEAFYDAVASSQINIDNESIYERDQKIMEAARYIDGLLEGGAAEDKIIEEVNRAIAMVDERNEFVKNQLMRSV